MIRFSLNGLVMKRNNSNVNPLYRSGREDFLLEYNMVKTIFVTSCQKITIEI